MQTSLMPAPSWEEQQSEWRLSKKPSLPCAPVLVMPQVPLFELTEGPHSHSAELRLRAAADQGMAQLPWDTGVQMREQVQQHEK